MIFGGIDGCKAGWLLITYESDNYDWQVVPQINDLTSCLNQKSRVFIDMPVGLASKEYPRTIEQVLRKELENRSSTVFSVPVRAAVYEENRDRAKQLNKEVTGKSLSEQSLNIKDKICEVDLFIRKCTSPIELIESHPELCFKYLNGSVLQTKKSQKAGIEERLSIINRYDPDCAKLFYEILKNTLRKNVKPDDIADALVLCLANRLNSEQQPDFLIDANLHDAFKIPIRIGYHNPESE